MTVGAVEDREIDIPRMLPERGIDILVTLLKPLERVTRPKLYGAENIPADGSLLVGNHTLYGLLDLPFMLAELWKRRHLTVRSLGERAHYAIPLWREALTLGGMVRGTRENVRALMDERQTVLVFPGGSREVNKRRGEKYQLMWKERIGFARLAIEYGYPIVPFAAVGAEEMLDIVIDETNPAFARLGDVVEEAHRLADGTPRAWRRTDPPAAPRAPVLLVRRADRHHPLRGSPGRRRGGPRSPQRGQARRRRRDRLPARRARGRPTTAAPQATAQPRHGGRWVARASVRSGSTTA